MAQRVTIEALADWLRDKDDIAVLGHVSPDGDAVGTTMAVWYALKAMGKRAVPCLPGGLPGLYPWLPGIQEVRDPADALPFVPRTAFSVDVSDPERLGEDGLKLFNSCPFRAALDHHSTNTGFGQVYFLDGEAAAAGEIAVDLIDALGVPLGPEISECLFVAISTDCGNYNYSCTRPGTFRAAARCVEGGADVARITELLYRTRTVARTRLLATVLVGMEISADGKLAWARLTDDMLRQTGASPEDNEGIVNYLQEINTVQIAVLASQRGEGTKLSLRCIEALNVARDVATPLGGGGHQCAAGATVNLPMEEALGQALALARKAIERAEAE